MCGNTAACVCHWRSEVASLPGISSGRLIDRRSPPVHRIHANALEARTVPLVPPCQNNCVITQTIPPGFRTMQGQINAC